MHLDSARDPLRVLESTKYVVENANQVGINVERLRDAAVGIAIGTTPGSNWSTDPQAGTLQPAGYSDRETSNLILVLDGLNFCFWSPPAPPTPRWQVTYKGVTYNGYFALAAALRLSIERGIPLSDAGFLAEISHADVEEILKGDAGCQAIPLLDARRNHLREAGAALLKHWDGDFCNAILAAKRSAVALVSAVVTRIPSFNDVANFNGGCPLGPVRLFKRAQILAADLHGAFDGQGPGAFYDLDLLTAFADYKVPQVLRRFGILEYAPELQDMIRSYTLIPAGSHTEIEIRATTIWAVELLRQELRSLGHDLPAYQIDWALWQAGQQLPGDSEPYHRTLTVYY